MGRVRVVIAILVVWSFGLTLFTFLLRRDLQRNRQSLDFLTGILEFRKWELPMPKDTRYEWHFELRDYREPNVVTVGKDDWMDGKKKATNVFMPTGQDEIYRFWLVQREGTSSGSTRLDVCNDPDDIRKKCDFGQLDFAWQMPPKRIEDGKSYIICEISELGYPQRRKQLVLYLGLFRLEDIQRNSAKL
jgi:hypothetical protein